MTSTMVFISHIHGLTDMSHVWKGKGWFSLLSMQNIIFQYKMVLDDFFFISKGSIQVRKLQKQKKYHSFSARATATAKLGMTGQRAEPQNMPATSASSQFRFLQRGYSLILHSCFSFFLLPFKWFSKVFWELDFKYVQIRNFQNKAFYKNMSPGKLTCLAW